MIFWIVAVIGVIILAILGLFMVFGTPNDELKEILLRTLWIIGILTAASLLVSLVTKKTT
jgi:type IV secretory pathway VirB2 component (pilin)